MAATPAPLYYEDITVGDSFRTASVEVTREEIVAFATRYDPQPFHLSEEGGRASVFGGLVASGWLTGGLSMRLTVEAGMSRFAGGFVGLGLDSIQWPHPVRPGDILTVENTVLETRVSKSRPGYGIVKARCVTTNQRGEVVQILVVNQLAVRRPD